MQIFHKRTDNSKNERCQGFQNFTFQFIYAQRSKKCMMVCNSISYIRTVCTTICSNMQLFKKIAFISRESIFEIEIVSAKIF